MEEHRQNIFENREISGPKGDEMVGGWRKLRRDFRTCTLPKIKLE
jgi:hypothetical protein